MINVGIYLDPLSSNLEAMGPAIKFFKEKYDIVSTHIFSDNKMKTYVDMACLSSFYMSFYRDALLFTSVQDFLSNQYNIISNTVYVVVSKKELEENYINKNSMKNVKILSLQNGEINEL
jgi:hypothetical protein